MDHVLSVTTMKTVREWLELSGQWTPDTVAVRVGDQTIDLHTPVERAEWKVLRADEPLGLEVIRHSTAHVMADAVQRLFPGTKVTFGPAVEDGFFYDFDKPGGPFTEQDLEQIEQTMLEIISKNSPFRREIVSRTEAISLFESMGERYKVEHIRTIPEGEAISLYRHGGVGDREWIDLCAGPHVPSTGFLKAIKLTSVAGAYWRGDERNPMLQRIYGTAFASQEALEAHVKGIEEAKKRDHRKLGRELDLFWMDPVAPAMPFFLPKGAWIYNRLIEYVRTLYARYDYEEVITPQAFDPKLFRTSGHLENYNENMYRLWTEDQIGSENGSTSSLKDQSFALKPMNCPAHCVLFASRKRSYRELPWRIADFGRLHRYERGGVVHGLARVRSLAQDDAHIFCPLSLVAQEIEQFIHFIDEVYRVFEFNKLEIKLATRPTRRLGTDEEWDKSESALAEGLKRAGIVFENAEGEGAFYGPKIEFHVQDALKRNWQLGTLQYDSSLPARFGLEYIGEDGRAHRPVMLHRAALGSLERFFSLLIEHSAGKFPVWIAPKQAILLTVSEKANAYATRVYTELKEEGFRIEMDLGADQIGAKIRNAHGLRYPYIAVIGGKEEQNESVALRSRDHGDLGTIKVREWIERLRLESVLPGIKSKTHATKD